MIRFSGICLISLVECCTFHSQVICDTSCSGTWDAGSSSVPPGVRPPPCSLNKTQTNTQTAPVNQFQLTDSILQSRSQHKHNSTSHSNNSLLGGDEVSGCGGFPDRRCVYLSSCRRESRTENTRMIKRR